MKKRNAHQKLPNNWNEREKLREKGQFWTPDWVAEAMVHYVIGGGSSYIFDPAVGEGAFFRAAKKIATQSQKRIRLLGTEIDEQVKHQAMANGLTELDYQDVEIRDFVLDPPAKSFKAIVANPPYIRHHRLSIGLKNKLKQFAVETIGKALDGRTGYHIYFLLRALCILEHDGRLSYIMSADTCEGIFANELWEWITSHYRLEAVITFVPNASPFPGVDTNPLIFMIRNCEPETDFFWIRVNKAQTWKLSDWIASGFSENRSEDLSVHKRQVEEGLKTGLSRPPRKLDEQEVPLSRFAKVIRGIATGSNEFFFMTAKRASEIGIPDEFLITAIGRTGDVEGDTIDANTIENLERAGRPFKLLSLDGRPTDKFSKAVADYLKEGEKLGLPKRALIAQRNPWYKMETRRPPEFLFTYLGRRNARFIRNLASAVPLTSFLCVYALDQNEEYIDKLWKVLRHPRTIENLSLVGKSYGEGAIKVEPRALERLPIPLSIIKKAGLRVESTE